MSVSHRILSHDAFNRTSLVKFYVRVYDNERYCFECGDAGKELVDGSTMMFQYAHHRDDDTSEPNRPNWDKFYCSVKCWRAYNS